jgi:hypothetical protein
MGEKSDQIERQIEFERGQLGQNLNELQSKIDRVTDWRTHFQKRPMMLVGAAFGSGLLLASMKSKRPSARRHNVPLESSDTGEHRLGTSIQKNQALETLDSIKGAMIGVAANTFKDFLAQLIPGFRAQFEQTVQEKRSSS